MAEFTGNSGNILPQIMLLAAWGSRDREGERGRQREEREREMEGEKKNRHGLCVCGLEEEAGLKTTERERNL